MKMNPCLKILFTHTPLLPTLPRYIYKEYSISQQNFAYVHLISLGRTHVDRLKGYYEGINLYI